MRSTDTGRARRSSVALVVLVARRLHARATDETTGDRREEEPKEPYVIGAVLSLTGTHAGLGEPEKNTIEMEVARINDAGGINGHPLEVVIEDDARNVDQAIAATTKLIEQDERDRDHRFDRHRADDGDARLRSTPPGSRRSRSRAAWSSPGVRPARLPDAVVERARRATTLEYLEGRGYHEDRVSSPRTPGFGKDGRDLVNARQPSTA